MFIKAGLLIAYLTTIVTTEGSLEDLYELQSLDPRMLLFHKNKLVLPVKTEENHLPDNRHTVEFNINNNRIKLNLTLSTREVVSSKTPIWLIKSTLGSTSNYSYELVKNTKEMLNGQFYVDNKNKAVLFARYNRNQNRFLYDGVIGEGSNRHLVYSIPEHLGERTKRADEKIENQIIIDSPETYGSDDDELIIIERNGIELTKLDKPLETLYPKMLIVVDYQLFKYLNFDVAETVRYVATFWNIVDQKYAKIELPKIEIVVNSIVIVNDKEALDYIYQYKSDTDEFDIHKLLNSTRTYFSEKFINDTGFFDYDAIMIMTGLKMKPLNGFFDVFGLTAKLGGICTRDNNIAITTDKAQYNTLVAIHELGHLLNLSHDYAEECDGVSYLFGPLNTSVMSAPSDGTDIFWSGCSLRSLKEFSTLKAAECLRNRHRTK